MFTQGRLLISERGARSVTYTSFNRISKVDTPRPNLTLLTMEDWLLLEVKEQTIQRNARCIH